MPVLGFALPAGCKFSMIFPEQSLLMIYLCHFYCLKMSINTEEFPGQLESHLSMDNDSKQTFQGKGNNFMDAMHVIIYVDFIAFHVPFD